MFAPYTKFEIESPIIELLMAAKNPAHIKLSAERSCSFAETMPGAFAFFLSARKTSQAISAVERWQAVKKIPVCAKKYKSRFEKKAQIKPGTRPHKAVTAIVITESR